MNNQRANGHSTLAGNAQAPIAAGESLALWAPAAPPGDRMLGTVDAAYRAWVGHAEQDGRNAQVATGVSADCSASCGRLLTHKQSIWHFWHLGN